MGAIAFYFLDGIIIRTVSPLWRADNLVSRKISEASEFFHTQRTLVAENNRLKERMASLELELSSLSTSLALENYFLKFFGRTEESGGIVVGVLTYPPETPYDIIVIDAGSNESVSVGMKAVLLEGPVVGEVTEVFASSAKVTLFTSAGERTNAIMERTGMVVTLEGAGGGNFRIVVPRETPVEIGDRILTPDISSRLIGVVAETNVEPTDSFKEVLARSPANIFNLHFLLVRP